MVVVRTSLRNPTRGCAWVAVASVALFIGLMIASAGVAIYPRVADPAARLICAGTVEYESFGASYRPGEYTVTREIWCRTGEGKAAAREEITLRAVGVAFLLYSAIAFVLLVALAYAVRRRTRHLLTPPAAGGTGWTMRTADPPREADVMTAAGPASPADISSILAKVAEAVERGGANVVVRNLRHDSAAGDADEPEPSPAERLERLKALLDQGLITAQEYQAKRAEILSGL